MAIARADRDFQTVGRLPAQLAKSGERIGFRGSVDRDVKGQTRPERERKRDETRSRFTEIIAAEQPFELIAAAVQLQFLAELLAVILLDVVHIEDVGPVAVVEPIELCFAVTGDRGC